jgi:hypothetical protein
MRHRERGMNVTTLRCRRQVSAYSRDEHGNILPQLDISSLMTENTVLTKCYYSTMHTTGPCVRN